VEFLLRPTYPDRASILSLAEAARDLPPAPIVEVSSLETICVHRVPGFKVEENHDENEANKDGMFTMDWDTCTWVDVLSLLRCAWATMIHP